MKGRAKMKKLILDNYYYLKGFSLPLKFIGVIKANYTCDLCNKIHYFKTLPLLYCFEVNKDNLGKFGTSCIKKVLK